MQELYEFTKSGAVVRILPETSCTLKDFGTCVEVTKVPEMTGQDRQAMIVPMSALRKLSETEREEFIRKQLRKALGLSEKDKA